MKAVPLIRAIELLESHFEKGSGVLTAVQVTKTFYIPINEMMKLQTLNMEMGIFPITNSYKTELPGHLDKYLNNMKARLARRQLAKVTNEGLIEYALQVILIFSCIFCLQFFVILNTGCQLVRCILCLQFFSIFNNSVDLIQVVVLSDSFHYNF